MKVFENVFNDLMSEIKKNKNKYVLENYILKNGSTNFVLFNYPTEKRDFLDCLLYKQYVITDVKVGQHNNVLVQKRIDELDANDYKFFEELINKFNVKIFTNSKPNRLKFEDSEFICDDMYKHSSVSTSGLYRKKVFEKYFN